MLRSFDPALADRREGDSDLDIADPCYGGASGFRDLLTDIEVACAGVVVHVRTSSRKAG